MVRISVLLTVLCVLALLLSPTPAVAQRGPSPVGEGASDRLGRFQGRGGASRYSGYLTGQSPTRATVSPHAGPLQFSGQAYDYQSPGAGTSPYYATPMLKAGTSGMRLGWGRGGFGMQEAIAAYRSTGTIGLGQIIPLGREGSVDEEDPLLASILWGDQMIEPLTGKGLARPSPSATHGPSPSIHQAEPSQTDALAPQYADRKSLAKHRATLYAARQTQIARNCISSGKYEQALVSYGAALTLDRNNREAVAGKVYCMLLTGRYQVAGVCMRQLAQLWPDFWRHELNHTAVFGISKDRVVGSLLAVEPEIDNFIAIHRAETSRSRKNVTLALLGKLFIAWTSGNRGALTDTIQQAASESPFDEDIQTLYRKITGSAPEDKIELEKLAPVG